MGFGTEERGVDWKESLAALSGGQRALIALSLLLALLKLKPAPIYILDEVDAALDLSHTQNLGIMIRRCFKQSQFIIVSHYSWMIFNASVVFQVVLRPLQGYTYLSSTVERTDGPWSRRARARPRRMYALFALKTKGVEEVGLRQLIVTNAGLW